jgi:hypothetical protein
MYKLLSITLGAYGLSACAFSPHAKPGSSGNVVYQLIGLHIQGVG